MSESEFYYPDELEFNVNFEEKEKAAAISSKGADADHNKGNSASQEEIETFLKNKEVKTRSGKLLMT